MCGVAGVYGFRGSLPVDGRGQLDRVRDLMRNRGPDSAGTWWNDKATVGLAHRRLAIIDLDQRAAQPMHLGPLAIVFNGEIYNYRSLRQDLVERHGFRPRTESDTEVILALYQLHGSDFARYLRGMFALAIWDGNRNKLVLARDPYGIKPLYYASSDGALRFASQVKALSQWPEISREVDPAGLVGFELFGSVPEPFTTIREIAALPAGTIMEVGERGASEPRTFASVPEVLANATRDDRSDIDEVIRDAVRDSVTAHMVADVEVGAFLSAGIDSGALVGLMRDVGAHPIRAITLGFEDYAGTPADEVPLAAAVARGYGAEHVVRMIGPEEFSRFVDRILGDMDQPTVDGINSWFVSMAAHEAGLKVVVSGLGGDELLAGYPTFRTVPRLHRTAGWVARLPFASRVGRSLLQRLAPELIRRNPKALGVLDHAGTFEGSYLLRRAVMLPFELEQKLSPELVRAGLLRLDPEGHVRRAMQPNPRSAIARMSALESGLYMRNQLLRDSDWASMAHSLELRVPLVDWRTLQRVAPVMHRLGNGAGKRALARSPSQPLPASIASRAKTGFSVPFAKWTGLTQRQHDRRGSRLWALRVADAFGLS